MKILIVDDDPKYRTFVAQGLNESSMVCAMAPDGESALEILRTKQFDLVLLDVMMPGMQGWDVMRTLRSEGIDVPVIWVTARDAVDERVKGLRMGGDDYIVKPFAFAELVARIHVVLRNRQERTRFRLADLEIDYLGGKVTRAGRTIDTTRTEYSLLRCLADRCGEATSRTELLQTVWGLDFDPGTNIVEVQIRRLRQKIDEPFDRPLIHTVRHAGYVLDKRD
ncbi:MAG: response regulator [Planctomycetota bacterium]